MDCGVIDPTCRGRPNARVTSRHLNLSNSMDRRCGVPTALLSRPLGPTPMHSEPNQSAARRSLELALGITGYWPSSWRYTVGKHLFSDGLTAATETLLLMMPKMYGKPCRHTPLYGNLKSRVFRLCWSVTCASRPNRIGRSQAYNVMHCWRRASTAGTCLKLMPPAPNMGAREPVWAVRP